MSFRGAAEKSNQQIAAQRLLIPVLFGTGQFELVYYVSGRTQVSSDTIVQFIASFVPLSRTNFCTPQFRKTDRNEKLVRDSCPRGKK